MEGKGQLAGSNSPILINSRVIPLSLPLGQAEKDLFG